MSVKDSDGVNSSYGVNVIDHSEDFVDTLKLTELDIDLMKDIGEVLQQHREQSGE